MLKKMEELLPWYKDDPWYCKVIIIVEVALIAGSPFVSIYLELVRDKLPF